MSNADENDEAEAHYLRALALWEAGNAKAAADALDLAMQKRPNFPEALAMGGYILEQNGSSDAAMRFYLRATTRPGIQRCVCSGSAVMATGKEYLQIWQLCWLNCLSDQPFTA